MPQHFIKDSDSIVDFSINWVDWLGTDTISTSTWTATTGITIVTSSKTSTKTTIWVSGGTSGVRYSLTNRIVTAGGRTDDRTLTILVRDK